MSNWSELKYHRQSKRYYRYQELGLEVHLLESKTPQALEINGVGCHNHYFRVSDRWYIQSDIPNQRLFKWSTGGGIERIWEDAHLNCLLDELKLAEVPQVDEATQAITTEPNELQRSEKTQDLDQLFA